MRRNHNRIIPKVGKKLHMILVIDGSGSMKNKISAVHDGLREELNIREDGVEIYFTLISFSSQIKTHYTRNQDPYFENCYHGYRTVLYDAVIKAIEEVKEDENTVIKVFTDGKDYTSVNSQKNMKDAIEKTHATVSFQMTKEDESYIVNDIGIDKSNTFTYVNNLEGTKLAAKASVSATRGIARKVLLGKSLSRGIYND